MKQDVNGCLRAKQQQAEEQQGPSQGAAWPECADVQGSATKR
ncbi:hypothetical protein ACJU26_00930 [Acidithiobacillus sp. M4-SHS-6]